MALAPRLRLARIDSAAKMAPAMAAGVCKTLWSMSDIVALIDEAATPPQPRGPYRQHVAA